MVVSFELDYDGDDVEMLARAVEAADKSTTDCEDNDNA